MKATKQEYYWAKYERNNKSIWIGENSESLIQKKLFLNQLHILKKHWTIITNISELIDREEIFSIDKNYYYCFPEAKDIIPFVLLSIQEKKIPYYTDNNINYLYNI